MNLVKKCLPVLLTVIAGAAVFAFMSGKPAEAARGGGVKCPMIWAPVICDGDKIYSNQCFADKAHARNCVPYGGI